MTTQYAIVAFPVSEAAAAIEAIRGRFDPLAAMLRAHITLVFPFTDGASDAELSKHLAGAVADQGPIDIVLSEVAGDDDGYVFLNVETGADVLGVLHDRLYTGVLASHRSSAHRYRPHITIGRLPDPEHAQSAVAEARQRLALPIQGRISEVALFRIDESGRGAVVLTAELSPDSVRTAPNVRCS